MVDSNQIDERSTTPNNMGLFRLHGFSGRLQSLQTLHGWLTKESNDVPAIAISGAQGIGKSSLATAVAWNHFYHFNDGIIRVGAAGGDRLRIYDIVRTMDMVFGTTLTRLSEERWGINILEQLYRRRRLLIIDELSGATEAEVNTLVDIVGHLHDAGGHSRILLIDRDLSPSIETIVQHRSLVLGGLDYDELDEFICNRAPDAVVPHALDNVDKLYTLSQGHPFILRLFLGLLLDYRWDELQSIVQTLPNQMPMQPTDTGDATEHDTSLQGDRQRDRQGTNAQEVQARFDVVSFAVENTTLSFPEAVPLLNRLVSAAGGASFAALSDLFWSDLGDEETLQQTLSSLQERGLIDLDHYNQRIVMHPLVRRYVSQSAVMLGEEWERGHARYYQTMSSRYQKLPVDRWPEIDVEWGNIHEGADWCAGRIKRIWQDDLLSILQDPRVDEDGLEPPLSINNISSDLRLTRDYALALAHYAFWRHPPGIINWLVAGAVASLALKDMRNYAWILTSIGRQLFFKNDVDAAIRWLERARKVFTKRDSLAELVYVYTDLATSMRVIDKPRTALEYFYIVIDCIAELGDSQSLATAYMNLGSAHYSMGNYEQALQQNSKALRVAMRVNNHYAIASAYNNMGLALEQLNRLDEAYIVYKQALAKFINIDDKAGRSTCYNNLGSISYTKGDCEEAVYWYNLDLKLSEERGMWTDMAATLHNLGHVATEQKEYQQAIRYFSKSRDLYAVFQLDEYVREEEEMLTYIAGEIAKKK